MMEGWLCVCILMVVSIPSTPPPIHLIHPCPLNTNNPPQKTKPHRVVDPEVEGEAADEGNGGGGDQGEALEVEGRDGVESPGEDAP